MRFSVDLSVRPGVKGRAQNLGVDVAGVIVPVLSGYGAPSAGDGIGAGLASWSDFIFDAQTSARALGPMLDGSFAGYETAEDDLTAMLDAATREMAAGL